MKKSLCISTFSDIPRVSLTLSQTLDGALIRKGDTVYLHCEIKANPTVHTIEWSRDQVISSPLNHNEIVPSRMK